jgi:NAD dependent epimerase/dehydratase family enzyme
MGEEMLLGGQRALPERLTEAGFAFAHPDIRGALEHVLE